MSGIKCETVGDIRRALKNCADDTPIQFVFDDADYRAIKIAHLYPAERDGFVKIEPTE